MLHSLIIGFGNLDRLDDGVAFYVVNALRQRLGQNPLDEDCSDGCQADGRVDSIFIRQLVPELTGVARRYDRLIFVDAHLNCWPQKIKRARIYPRMNRAALSHIIHPELFLWMLKTLYDHEPAGHLLSIRGHHFDFGRGLTAATAELVVPAVNIILRLIPVADDLQHLDTQHHKIKTAQPSKDERMEA